MSSDDGALLPRERRLPERFRSDFDMGPLARDAGRQDPGSAPPAPRRPLLPAQPSPRSLLAQGGLNLFNQVSARVPGNRVVGDASGVYSPELVRGRSPTPAPITNAVSPLQTRHRVQTPEAHESGGGDTAGPLPGGWEAPRLRRHSCIKHRAQPMRVPLGYPPRNSSVQGTTDVMACETGSAPEAQPGMLYGLAPEALLASSDVDIPMNELRV
jgi:hypothetical protein